MPPITPETLLDKWTMPGPPTHPYGSYKVIWRGWFSSATHTAILGKWVAFPRTAFLPTLPCLVSLAGSPIAGSFLAGERWNDDIPDDFPQRISREDVTTEAGRTRMVERRHAALQTLYALIDRVEHGEGVPAVDPAPAL